MQGPHEDNKTGPCVCIGLCVGVFDIVVKVFLHTTMWSLQFWQKVLYSTNIK